jgi:N-acetylglucosaminyldiphosphoundecaprenol N-acetyl-beta-D-mannosaminyltransferase
MKKIHFFGIIIHPLSKSEFLEIIESNLKNGNQIIQNGINAASVNELVKNEELKQAYKNSDLINIDGFSVVLALRFLGFRVPERVACPDLADDILTLAQRQNYSVFLFGAKKTIVLLCKKKLQAKFPNLLIVGCHSGYYKEDEEEAIIDMINSAHPDILFLGLPTPCKELFVEKYRHKLNAKYILGVGGLFDILSGLKKRAPTWIQNNGLEWCYRFAQEPNRLWRRYLIGNFNYLRLVLKEMNKIYKI